MQEAVGIRGISIVSLYHCFDFRGAFGNSPIGLTTFSAAPGRSVKALSLEFFSLLRE